MYTDSEVLEVYYRAKEGAMAPCPPPQVSAYAATTPQMRSPWRSG